ncbi:MULTISPECIES: response regulator transcription factor [unclassified Microbacterium]|uniref:response regulator transcription factor n=1 Tax=unclassified Microbacterium TaxID=2609290 RepID=UPI000EA8BC7D|nr:MULTISPECIES: response regulator transcription factor [unclassified Microbacterium]MBT2485020.1 response regulator transcription factor [Microbacterium sp. ISL-108]RKN67870.1 DNA-binding response regulator [Microbacterium sp. CGR2]
MTQLPERTPVVVIIEDDAGVRSLLDEVFLAAGFHTVLAGSGLEGLAAVEAHTPLITTLDINLPGIDGFEVARRIRKVSSTFIIMLSALADESDVVLGLTSGADEYLVKPFRPRELRARIEALMRRPRLDVPIPGQASGTTAQTLLASLSAPTAPTSIADATAASGQQQVHRDLSLDLATHTVRAGNRTIDLTPTEFDLLAALLASKRQVRSKSELAIGLRGSDTGSAEYVSEPDKRAIETHIANLRRKLGDSSTAPHYIETVRGVGYRLTAGDGDVAH